MYSQYSHQLFQDEQKIYCPHCDGEYFDNDLDRVFNKKPVEGHKQCQRCNKYFWVYPDTKVVYIYRTEKSNI